MEATLSMVQRGKTTFKNLIYKSIQFKILILTTEKEQSNKKLADVRRNIIRGELAHPTQIHTMRILNKNKVILSVPKVVDNVQLEISTEEMNIDNIQSLSTSR